MTDILITKKNVILDATLLTSIMNCGRFTDLRFNHSFVQLEGKSNSLECGSIVHKVLEVYYKSLINRVSKQDSIGLGLIAGEMYIKGCQYCTDFTYNKNCDKNPPLFEHSWDHDNSSSNTCKYCGTINKPSCGHSINEYPGVKNTPIESEGYKTGWKYVLQTCEEYFEHYKNDYWVPLEVETVKREILFENDDIRIMWKAKLDLVVDTNQAILPIDHKTMKQRRDTLSLNNQFIGQCIIMKTRNVIINKIGFQTSLKPAEKFIRSTISYSSDRLIEWQSETLPYWAYQLLLYNETEYYPPNHTNCETKYGNCMYKDVCEADRGMREEILKNNFVVGLKWDPSDVSEE